MKKPYQVRHKRIMKNARASFRSDVEHFPGELDLWNRELATYLALKGNSHKKDKCGDKRFWILVNAGDVFGKWTRKHVRTDYFMEAKKLLES